MNPSKYGARRWFWLAPAFAMALVCVPGRDSRADDKSDLIGKIEDKLEDAGDALERLPDDSNDGAIDRARSYVAEARRYADELARVAGDDSNARRIAQDFDDVQDDFHEALGHLRNLKAGQRTHEPVVTACGERSKDLTRKAREFESKNDPDGLTELPRLATQAQEATRRQLDELARQDDRMEDWADDADDFSGDGPWRELTSSVAGTARRTYEGWKRGQDQATRGCELVAKGVDYPDVKDVLYKLGNSAGGRKAVIEQLNKDARYLASVLAGVSEDSGMGSVERAKSLLQSIERGVETLGRTPTTDKETRLILDKWPEAIRQLKEALDDLEDLKVHQHDMDPLPEKCDLKKRELQDAIARNGSDTDGIEELPKLADAIAQPVIAGLAKAEERMKEENDDLQRARNVSASEGPWNDIRNAEQRDADETHRTFKDGYDKTKAVCADVVKGKDAPAVKDAVENLRRGASSSSTQLERDVQAWVARARATYELDCQGMKDIWAGFCSQDWEPGDEAEQKAAGRAAAEPVKERMRAAIDGLVNDLPGLEAQVKLLADKRETQKVGRELTAELTKQKARLLKLQANPAIRGNYDVILQFANTYGKQQHGRMWGRHTCKAPIASDREAIFPAEGRKHSKPDCVDPEACMVWEFKPKGDEGERKGRDQKRDYQYLVPLYYNKLVRAEGTYDAAATELGGVEIMKALMAKCYRGGAIMLTAEVEDYDVCKEQYECTRD